MDVTTIQEALKARGFYKGQIDGLAGPMTRAAINAALDARELGNGWQKWSVKRRRNAYAQLMCQDLKIEVGPIDGLIGPQTTYAFGVYQHRKLTKREPEPWRDHVPDDDDPPPVRNSWPRYRDLTRFYGSPGKNQARVELPYTVRIAWNTKQTLNSFLCHEKVEPSMKRVLDRVLDHYGEEQIKKLRLDLFGGCLNVRKMRGGTKWSVHAWGIALDFDPIRNQLRWGRDKASFAKPEYEKWHELWEAEGWLNLGRARNFDWMHTQASRL